MPPLKPGDVGPGGTINPDGPRAPSYDAPGDLTPSGQPGSGTPLKKADIPDGAWLPHVAEAVRIIAGTFNVPASTYEGHGVQAGGMSTAADFVTGSWGVAASGADKTIGDAIVGFAEANWTALNINYVIWYDRIKGPQTGGSWIQYPADWKAAYGGGSGPSVEHTDHVHISFNQSGEMPDMASLNPPGALPISNTIDNAMDWVKNIPEWIASGFANALLRFIKAVYGYTILRPLDFAGGFWWELTKKITGWRESWNEGGDSNVFSEDNKKRLWTLVFLFCTYYLAFGRDKNTGKHHMDRMLEGGSNLVNRDMEGTGRYNDTARIRADVQGVTVARRRQRHTVRRKTGDGGGTERRGTVKRRVSGTPERDTSTGRFTAKRTTTPEEETSGRWETQGTTRRNT